MFAGPHPSPALMLSSVWRGFLEGFLFCLRYVFLRLTLLRHYGMAVLFQECFLGTWREHPDLCVRTQCPNQDSRCHKKNKKRTFPDQQKAKLLLRTLLAT